jgi:hypothetical protein
MFIYAEPRFHYQSNLNDTFNSICGRCFRTVGTSHDLTALRAFELAHQCLEADLLTRERLLNGTMRRPARLARLPFLGGTVLPAQK